MTHEETAAIEFAAMVANIELYGDEQDDDAADAMETLNKVIVRAREITAEINKIRRPEIKSN